MSDNGYDLRLPERGAHTEEPEYVTTGHFPPGTEGSIIAEWWKSGLTSLKLEITYREVRDSEWEMSIEMLRKDGKAIEGSRSFRYRPPQNPDELWWCFMDATRRIRKMAPLTGKIAVKPPMLGNADLAAERAFRARGEGRG